MSHRVASLRIEHVPTQYVVDVFVFSSDGDLQNSLNRWLNGEVALRTFMTFDKEKLLLSDEVRFGKAIGPMATINYLADAVVDQIKVTGTEPLLTNIPTQ